MNPEPAENSAERLLQRWVDPLLTREPTRLAPAILAFAICLSAALCLWVSRGTIYTGDELAWFSLAPDLSLKEALEPGSGHLLLVSKVVYTAILEVFGNHYVIFRLLTLGTVFLATGLFFYWARRRVGDFLALAPCLVLLFFGTDPGHLLQGNGFTIMLAVSAGLLALIALERETRGGDLLACLSLCIGLATYSVAIAFLAGAIVAILFGSNRRRRIWVVAIPAALYLAWRVWVLAVGFDSSGGDPEILNIFLLPAWTFQSLSGILSALTGVHYNFSNGGSWVDPGEMAGPALALVFVVWVGWRINRGSLSTWFWVVVVVALALFTIQVLTSIPGIRNPGTSRYLYPGAIVVLLVLAEGMRSSRVNRTTLIATWLIALTATATGAMLIRDSGAAFRQRAIEARGDITAVGLLERSRDARPGPGAIEVKHAIKDFDAADAVPAEIKYGRIGYGPEQISEAPPAARDRLDAVLLAVTAPYLQPEAEKLGNCKKVGPVVNLFGGRSVIYSKNGGAISIRRFGDGFNHAVGDLPAGQASSLVLPVDDNPTPWQIRSEDPDLRVCA